MPATRPDKLPPIDVGAWVRVGARIQGRDPKKLDDPAVLKAALLESDLPAERLFELVQTAEVKDALMAETQRAVDRGTFGSPTFFVDGEIYFGKDRLRDVEEAIANGK